MIDREMTFHTGQLVRIRTDINVMDPGLVMVVVRDSTGPITRCLRRGYDDYPDELVEQDHFDNILEAVD